MNEGEKHAEGIKKEIDKPINRSYTIEDIDAEIARRAKGEAKQ